MLGPLLVEIDGRPVELHSQRARAVLALLALHVETSVPLSLLISRLWGHAPPPTAVAAVRNTVSGLRRDLPEGSGVSIDTVDGGYRLRLPDQGLDLWEFNARVERAHVSAAAGDDLQVVEHLDAALRLGRGPALADLTFAHHAWPEIDQIDQRMLEVTEELLLRQLAWDHRQMLPQVEQLLADHPEREGLHRARIVALHRSGRRLEATEAYLWARTVVAEATGKAPSAKLHETHQQLFTEEAGGRHVVAVGPGRSTGRGRVVLRSAPAANPAPSLFATPGPESQRGTATVALELRSIAMLCVTGTDDTANLTRVAESFGADVRGWRDGVFTAFFGLGRPGSHAVNPEPRRDDALHRATACAIAVRQAAGVDGPAIGDIPVSDEAVARTPGAAGDRARLACMITTGPVIQVLRSSGPDDPSGGPSWIAGELVEDGERWSRQVPHGAIWIR